MKTVATCTRSNALLRNCWSARSTTSPHIWTHVHRYVPSDSVWCESDSLSSPSARVPTQITDFSTTWEAMGDYVGFRHSDMVQIEKVSELTYSGSINCLCGWVTSGNPVQCASHPDSIVCADWDADDVEWQTVCTSGVISSKNDFFTLLRIMEEGAYEGWMEHCVESVPGVHWGLMDVSDVADWFDDAQPPVKFGMLHELASEGPGGLRIGLLGARINGNTLYEYVRKQCFGERARPIHRPILRGSIPSHSRTVTRTFQPCCRRSGMT